MDTLKDKMKKANWQDTYAATEYIIAVYVVVTTIINLLNIVGLTSLVKGVMQPTFYGASLIIMMLLQYGLVVANRKNTILVKLRPFVVGLMAAGIVSVSNLPLNILLVLVIGYFLMTGYQIKFDLKQAVLGALVACAGIEIYSVAMLLGETATSAGVSGFMNSIGPDVLFVLVAIAYCLVNRVADDLEGIAEEEEKADSKEKSEPDDEVLDLEELPETNETVAADIVAAKAEKDIEVAAEKQESVGEETANQDGDNAEKTEDNAQKTETNTQKAKDNAEKEESPWKENADKLQVYFAWWEANSKKIMRYTGGGICVIAMTLFLFYLVSVFAGSNKLANSGEEVYLLQHCEDTSLVLSLVEDKATNTYTIGFEEYTGANHQKVQLIDDGFGMCQIVFVEPQYALEASYVEGANQITLGVKPLEEATGQAWLREGFIPEDNLYKIYSVYSAPLSYQMLSQAKGTPAIMVQEGTGGYEFFHMERVVADEFVTKMVEGYAEEFTPTMLMETLISFWGEFSFVVFLLIVVVFGAIINARRFIGDKPAALYTAIFAYVLMYASIGAIVLFLFAFGLLCVNGYLRKQSKQRQLAVGQYVNTMSVEGRTEVQESLEKMQAALQEMQKLLLVSGKSTEKEEAEASVGDEKVDADSDEAKTEA